MVRLDLKFHNEWWNPYNEVDIEFGVLDDPGNVGQFVLQPHDWDWGDSKNKEPFDAEFTADEITSHAYRWLPDRIEFRSWRGGPDDEPLGDYIHTWTYTEAHLPRPEQARVHMNLWHTSGSPPDTYQEVIIQKFRFTPIPEPSEILLLSAGLGVLTVLRLTYRRI